MESHLAGSSGRSLKAVVLDWAGTAVDYGSFAPTAVFMRLFEEEGVRITAADARSGMGLMKRDHLKKILRQPNVAQAWQASHGASATEADIDVLFGQFVPMQMAVLGEYATPIPGLQEALIELRKRGLKIGSTTGYTRQMMDILAPAARQQGYSPDCIVCPDEVPAGRPYPWMCYRNAMELGVYPMNTMVKVGDTLVDIEEGRNAGMWTVGVTQTGNVLGMSETDVNALTPSERETLNQDIAAQLFEAGAHCVIDGIWHLPRALDSIESRLAHGERP